MRSSFQKIQYVHVTFYSDSTKIRNFNDGSIFTPWIAFYVPIFSSLSIKLFWLKLKLNFLEMTKKTLSRGLTHNRCHMPNLRPNVLADLFAPSSQRDLIIKPFGRDGCEKSFWASFLWCIIVLIRYSYHALNLLLYP